MNRSIVGRFVVIACLVGLIAVVPVHATQLNDSTPSEASAGKTDPAWEVHDLSAIISSFTPLSKATCTRRRIAQATFCLPQTVMGTLFYGLLQLTGAVVETVTVNDVRIIVTSAPIGASLGGFIFIHTSLQTRTIVRHEYGHTLQGYKYGPFYLPLVGAVSFAQNALSQVSPSFAAQYFERWPENEANVLGGIGDGGSS